MTLLWITDTEALGPACTPEYPLCHQLPGEGICSPEHEQWLSSQRLCDWAGLWTPSLLCSLMSAIVLQTLATSFVLNSTAPAQQEQWYLLTGWQGSESATRESAGLLLCPVTGPQSFTAYCSLSKESFMSCAQMHNCVGWESESSTSYSSGLVRDIQV